MYQRAHLDGEVLIHDENQLFIASVNNISAGGIFIDRLTTLPEGAVVRIVLKSRTLPGPLQAEGTIVRIEKSSRRGSAVRFTLLTEEAREIIANYVLESRMEGALKVA